MELKSVSPDDYQKKCVFLPSSQGSPILVMPSVLFMIVAGLFLHEGYDNNGSYDFFYDSYRREVPAPCCKARPPVFTLNFRIQVSLL